MPLSLKILTAVIRAHEHDGRAECGLNWNISPTTLALIVNFQ